MIITKILNYPRTFFHPVSIYKLKIIKLLDYLKATYYCFINGTYLKSKLMHLSVLQNTNGRYQ